MKIQIITSTGQVAAELIAAQIAPEQVGLAANPLRNIGAEIEVDVRITTKHVYLDGERFNRRTKQAIASTESYQVVG